MSICLFFYSPSEVENKTALVIADNVSSSDWEVLRWHLCREGVFLLFTGLCSLMPGQYPSPEKG